MSIYKMGCLARARMICNSKSVTIKAFFPGNSVLVRPYLIEILDDIFDRTEVLKILLFCSLNVETKTTSKR